MTVFYKILLSAIKIILLTLIVTVPSRAANLEGYTHFIVGNEVCVDIPFEWTIRNNQEIRRIKDLAKNITGKPSVSLTYLATDYHYDNSYYVSTRISFLQNDGYSQEDFENDLNSYGEDTFLKLFTIKMRDEVLENNKRNKYSQVDTDSLITRIAPLDNRKSLVFKYNRTSFNNSSNIISVEQYHVYNGDKDIMISLSYDRRCSYCKNIISGIKNSIHFIE